MKDDHKSGRLLMVLLEGQGLGRNRIDPDYRRITALQLHSREKKRQFLDSKGFSEAPLSTSMPSSRDLSKTTATKIWAGD